MINKIFCNKQIKNYGCETNHLVFDAHISQNYKYDYAYFRIFDENKKIIFSKLLKTISTIKYDDDDLLENKKYYYGYYFYKKDKIIYEIKSSFITGFTPKKALWISDDEEESNDVIEFEKSFKIIKPVEEARLFICGLGYFDAKINNKKLDDFYFKPLMSDYTFRVHDQYNDLEEGTQQTIYPLIYDVSKLIKNGINKLKVLVSNGYYEDIDKKEEHYWYGHKKTIYELRLKYQDGEEEIIVSDESSKVRKTNLKSTLFDGDIQDFSLKPNIFNSAKIVEAPTGKYKFQKCNFDSIDKKIKPKDVTVLEDGLLYDFSYNHSGGLYIKIKGEKNQHITIKYAEKLYDNGYPNFETSRFGCVNMYGEKIIIDQKNEYILSGNLDTIQPLFNYKCYRYAYIIGAKVEQIKTINSLFIHMQVDNQAYFNCSNNLINEIVDKSKLTILDNLHNGILSDCPHREKRPYTGDGNVVMESINYLLYTQGFFDKWLDDILNSQVNNGNVKNTAPNLGGGGGISWGMAVAKVPIILYQFTGDINYVKKSYNNVLKYVDYCKSISEENIIYSNGRKWFLGDWMSPEMTVSSNSLINTCQYYYVISVAIKEARILHKKNDLLYLIDLQKQVKESINKKFYNDEHGYCKGIQGENILPYYYKIVDNDNKKHLKKLIYDKYMNQNEKHLDTGIVLTPILFDLLFENNMEDLAYEILLNKTNPSFYKMLENETTIPEHWYKKWPDYLTGDKGELIEGGGELSHCHPMLGSIIAPIIKNVAGINLSKMYQKKVIFSPKFTKEITNCTYKVNTNYGVIETKWNNKNKLKINLLIPKGLETNISFIHNSKKLILIENGNKKVIYNNKNKKYKLKVNSEEITIQEE